MTKIRNAYYFACWNRVYSHASLFRCLWLLISVLYDSYRFNKTIIDIIEADPKFSIEDKDNYRTYIYFRGLQNDERNRRKEWFENEKFYEQYGQHSSDTSLKSIVERNLKYMYKYNMGAFCEVHPGVHFLKQHPKGTGILKIGRQCLFGGNNKIDYTGDLIIGNGVVINEGVNILTHGHQYLGARSDYFEEETHAYYSPLVIEDNVVIGANAMMLANVKTIGENSISSAGVVVNRPIPANTLVTPTGMKPIPNGMRTLYLYKKEE